MVHSSHLVTGLAARGDLRWVAVDLTDALEEARRRLDLSPIATVALGRALAGAVLVQRIALKTPTRLVLEVDGDGPLGKVMAEANTTGHLRGLVGNPQQPTPEEGLRLAPAVGRGVLRVTREGPRKSYSSQVALVSGELGEDLTHYLEQSEQIRSAVLLGVLLRPDGVAAAGGLVVEALPGTEDLALAQLETNVRQRDGVSVYLDRGGISALVDMALDGFDREPLDTLELEYRCQCTRQGLRTQLLPIARQDPTALLGRDGRCEAVCAFCGERYVFAADELLSTH